MIRLSLQAGCRLGLIGFIAGFVNGFIGIGGGTILIPSMILLLGEKQHIAHGTSLAIILPTAAVSAFIYQTSQHLDWGLALKIALSGMAGGYLGARLMETIPAPRLKQIFGIFMFLAGIRMIF
ncbi:MAG: sulfite exporter TauE/SafE family protein [Peptococcaceae bacterium]|nr:sulfite exporter TauE/SafE family protein [Peptococcaceae bacterium]MDH7525869.1 sulfite exporter TauE/SafE family protein [Peptococcaceae bacterium]